jgi:hypothetical protein
LPDAALLLSLLEVLLLDVLLLDVLVPDVRVLPVPPALAWLPWPSGGGGGGALANSFSRAALRSVALVAEPDDEVVAESVLVLEPESVLVPEVLPLRLDRIWSISALTSVPPLPVWSVPELLVLVVELLVLSDELPLAWPSGGGGGGGALAKSFSRAA